MGGLRPNERTKNAAIASTFSVEISHGSWSEFFLSGWVSQSVERILAGWLDGRPVGWSTSVPSVDLTVSGTDISLHAKAAGCVLSSFQTVAFAKLAIQA